MIQSCRSLRAASGNSRWTLAGSRSPILDPERPRSSARAWWAGIHLPSSPEGVEIERYREAIEYLRDAALSPRESTNLITEVRSLHRGGWQCS